MSWDIVLFNSSKKIESFDNFEELNLPPIDFCLVFEGHFENIKHTGSHREIVGNDYTIDYSIQEEPGNNMLLHLYGEAGLYELVLLAKKNGWQIFDTGCGEMIDLDNPSNNGYQKFQDYLNHVLNNRPT